MKSKLLLPLAFLVSISSFAQVGFQSHVIIDNLDAVNGVASIHISDVDGDGDLDVLSASQDDDKIAWYENMDGQGNFDTQKIITTETDFAQSVYSADLDGDGDMDVLSASANDNKIAWYENTDGEGNFGIQQIITSNAASANDVNVGDLDGDGDFDILFASFFNNKIAWCENTDGLGNFGPVQTITGNAEGAESVYASDIDNDGDLDVISASSLDYKIAWYENTDGLGSFGGQQIISINANGAKLALSYDLDGDGDLDVLSASSVDHKIAWYKNTDGLGSFEPELIISTNAMSANFVYASDLDSDGDLDVLSASGADDKIAWYENTDGEGNFGVEQIISTEANVATSVKANDIDNDGDMDIVSSSLFDNKITFFENLDGLGNFGQEQTLTSNVANGPESVYAIDIDGDNDMDVLSASFKDGKIAWYENINAQGGFETQHIITTSTQNATSVYPADLNGDGKMDVLSASYENKIAWHENTDGLGSFGLPQVITIEVGTAQSVYAIDIDGDGDMDVLSASLTDDKIAWYENMDGLGNFGAQQVISTEAFLANMVYATDLDGDNDVDVLSTSLGDDKIAWYENTDGQGNFSTQQIITTSANGASSVFSTDIDGDNDMDIISAAENDHKIAWYENTDGLGSFGEEQVVTTNANGAKSVYALDLDGDGDMDILSASYNDDKVAWYENIDGAGTFGVQQIITTNANGANSIFAIDLDNDGDADVLSTSYIDDKIVWYENIEAISNEINGIILYDDDNGCDTADLPVGNIMIETNNGTESFATFSIENGFFQVFPTEGDYITTLILPGFFTVIPFSHTSNFVGVGNTDVANFCIEQNQAVNDLAIAIYPTSQAGPGFNANYSVVYQNVGSTQLSGTVVIVFDDARLNFLTASDTLTSQTSNSLTFDYSDLDPFESKTIDLQFNVFTPPTVEIGDTLHFTATINPIAGDNTEADNVFTLDQTVIGSFDPNDITVIEGEKILLDDTDKYLHYIIRFQNTGTADAINVRVENTLDANLDWQTLQLESISHTNRVEIVDGNEVSFIFDNIHLPDSTANEPESHGFIAYKIKPKSDIALGDIIFNEADIFFDFNPAVETNTVSTEVVGPSSVNESTMLNFSVYPIPTSGILVVEAKTNIAQIEIYDRVGALVLLNVNQNKIDISSLEPGFYFCKVTNEEGDFGIKKMVKE